MKDQRARTKVVSDARRSRPHITRGATDEVQAQPEKQIFYFKSIIYGGEGGIHPPRTLKNINKYPDYMDFLPALWQLF